MRRSLRLLSSVLLLGCLVGCEQQEAVPLARSLPVATALALAAIVALPAAWLALDELSRRRTRPRAEVTIVARGLVAAVLLLSGLFAIVPMLIGIPQVAVGYRRPVVDIFSWEDIVQLTAFFEVAGLLLLLLQWRAAWLVWRRRLWGAVIALSEGLAVVFGAILAAVSSSADGLGAAVIPALAGVAFVAASWPVRLRSTSP